MCTIIYKKLQYPLQWQKKVNLSVKCVCIKVSKTPYSSLIQLKKYTHLECLAQILSFHKEIWASSLVSTMKSSLKDHLLNVCKLLESQFFSWYCFRQRFSFSSTIERNTSKSADKCIVFSLSDFFSSICWRSKSISFSLATSIFVLLLRINSCLLVFGFLHVNKLLNQNIWLCFSNLCIELGTRNRNFLIVLQSEMLCKYVSIVQFLFCNEDY